MKEWRRNWKKLSHLFAFLALKKKKAKFVELLTAQKLSLRAFQSFYIFIFFCYIDISWVPTWDAMMLCIWQFELELSVWSINFVKYYLNSVCLSYFFFLYLRWYVILLLLYLLSSSLISLWYIHTTTLH